MLKRTALFEEHTRLNGQMVDFGGWELPVQYTGVKDEHLGCRASVGLFDVSHMGEFHVEGPGAAAFLDYAVTNSNSDLGMGQARYTTMCYEDGGIVDDLLVYRRDQTRFLVVVNAANTAKDFEHMSKLKASFKSKTGSFTLTNESPNYTQIAIQGRNAEAILQQLTKTKLSEIKYYWFEEGTVLNKIPAVLARTGYTGEDGFEVYIPWKNGPEVWRALFEAGQPHDIKPCGLGARDTLRLEMKFPLYGNDISDKTNPLEAGLGWVVKLKKENFLGKTALVSVKEKGLQRKLVGLKPLDRGIPRHGYPVLSPDGKRIGEVTSGTQAPSLNEAIAIAYVPTAFSEIGSEVGIEIRGKAIGAQVVETPFYKRPY